MEPNNNIEKQFRQKLNQREIKPSEAAWDRLDAMLTVAEKPKKNYNWLYIAASFLGFILIGTIFFSQTEEIIDAPKNDIVLEHPINVQKSNTQPSKQIQLEPSNTIKEEVASQNKKSVLENKKIESRKEKIQIIQNKTNQNQVAQNSIINQKTEQKDNQNQIAQAPKTNNEISSQNQKPTYVDVDELLASVEKTSKKETNIDKKSKVKVDSGNLLSQVDGELELSFREKVINTVNKNYKTVKVALSNRNKE